jgi:hypothetical protein
MYRCTDPQDRVFAIIGFLKGSYLARVRIDYSQSVTELYTSVTRSIIEETESVICLSGAANHNGSYSKLLPSWVFDLDGDDSQRPSRLRFDFCKAALNTIPQASFCDNSSTIEMLGLHVDLINILEFRGLKENRAGWLLGNIGLPEWRRHFNIYPTGCDPHEAWLRTITADLGMSPDGLSRPSQANVQQYLTVSRIEYLENLPEGELEEAQEIFAQYQLRPVMFLTKRVFFISHLGYMGLGHPGVRKDDMVCVVPRCKVPLLIRKEDDHRVLVGECFVWGLMDGEAMKDKTEDDFEVFQLR